MSNVFTLGDMDGFAEQIDLDELYDKKREHDLSKLDIFNKLLNRIHTKIKMTSRQRIDEQFCWFVVPEMMIGIPRYNHAECVAYLVDKLQTNGFYVKYTHPNLLMISWKHWIPGYVRSEIKKKMNVSIDGYGNVVTPKDKEDITNPRMLMPNANMPNANMPNANMPNGLMPNGLANTNGNNTDSTANEESEKKKIGIYSLDLFKNLAK
jgi:hypothetical protein